MKRRRLIPAVMFIAAAPLFAHPHMLIVTTLEPEFAGTECTGMWVEWGFDTAFGASILHDFDKNKDGVFSPAETKDVHDHAFINLRKYGYFIFLRKGEVRKNPSRIENFSVVYRNKQLFYKFYVPLKGLGCSDDFNVSVFDSTYFCATRYAEPPVKLPAAGKGPALRCEVAENKKHPVYYNPYGAANDMTTYDKWKPGLNTAYPTEVRFFFEK